MTKTPSAKETHTRERLGTPTDLKPEATRDISAALAGLLADVFALYLKTKNFHWHMSGKHFRDYHLLLDEHGDQIFAMTDPIAERARKIGGTTLRSIGDIARRQRIPDNDAEYVDPQDMLAELRDDNERLTSIMRQVHNVCDELRRRRDREPPGSLDRRDRTPDLVPFRGDPQRPGGERLGRPETSAALRAGRQLDISTDGHEGDGHSELHRDDLGDQRHAFQHAVAFGVPLGRRRAS